MGGMDEPGHATHARLSRPDASAAVSGLGWRLVLGELRTQVLTGSLVLAADLAARAAVLPGAQGHLRLDVRSDRVLLALQTAAIGWVSEHDAELARSLSALADQSGLRTAPDGGSERSTQVLDRKSVV